MNWRAGSGRTDKPELAVSNCLGLVALSSFPFRAVNLQFDQLKYRIGMGHHPRSQHRRSAQPCLVTCRVSALNSITPYLTFGTRIDRVTKRVFGQIGGIRMCSAALGNRLPRRPGTSVGAKLELPRRARRRPRSPLDSQIAPKRWVLENKKVQRWQLWNCSTSSDVNGQFT